MNNTVLTEEDWEKRKKFHKPIEAFFSNKSFRYLNEGENKKVEVIGDNIFVIDKGLVFRTFLKTFQEITDEYDVFRGFNRIEELYPGYKRAGKEIDEISALKRFEKQGSLYFSAKNSIEFLANAQHYGLPTRLIDFTCNPYIAMFFATYGKLENESFYYIACAKYEENLVLESLPEFPTVQVRDGNIFCGMGDTDQYSVFYEKVAKINELLRCFYEQSDIDEHNVNLIAQNLRYAQEQNGCPSSLGISPEESRKKRSMIFIQPNLTNERIKNQQGLFMYPYVDDIEKHIDIIKNNVVILAIHKSYRDEIIKFLNRIGITEYKLMPDIVSVCNEIIRELKAENRFC